MNINILLPSILFLLVIVGFIYLWLNQKKQQQIAEKKLQELWKKIEAIQHDVSALCSGARGVDERVGGNEKRVRGLLNRLEDLEESDPSGHIQEFQEATKLAQEGAAAEEIVEKCNLTIDEAGLLVRLHQS